jgi:hypothetical protein
VNTVTEDLRAELVESLVEAARSHLAGWGIDCSVRYERSPLVRADATLALRWGGSRQRLAAHAMGSVRLTAVLAAAASASGAGDPVLVVAPWISPKVGARLREIGIAYVDSVGNASVRFGTVLIEVVGRPRPGRDGGADGVSPTVSSGERSGRLLTPANRRVIGALLADPDLEVAPLRELAAAAGVSVGQAHKSVTLLAAAGYHRDRMDEAQRTALAGVLRAIEALGE